MNALKWARTQWDRVAAWVLIGLGALFIILGWVAVGREALTAQQIPYIISGGIGGLFLLGVGAMLWLSADLRDEWRKLDAIERSGRAATTGDASGATEDDAQDPFRVAATDADTGNGDSPAAARRRRQLTARP